MKKSIFFTLLTLAAITSLTGCNTGSNTNAKPASSQVTDSATSKSAVDQTVSDADLKKQELEKKAKERELLEAERKKTYGEFYVPLPPIDANIEKRTVEAKGLYITGSVAGFKIDEKLVDAYASYVKALEKNDSAGKSKYRYAVEQTNKLEKAIGLAIATEVNSFVIDVKNDDGIMTYKSSVAITDTVGSNKRNSIQDVDRLLEVLKKNDIYAIARVVAFKDPLFANAQPKHAMQLKTGGVWKDNKGTSWVNQFDKYVWDYNVAIAKEAALKGFDEVQFDYVRFPDNAKAYNPVVEFPGREGRDKDEAIEDFLKYAQKELEPYGVHVAADVFGVITKSWDDKPEDIGQTWRKVANQTDYICPMVYPSHYGTNWYGFAVPDAHPFGVLEGSMKEAIERNAAQKKPALIRPWIQGFTASWIKGHINYTPQAIQDQILACEKYGIREYLIWDAGNTYDPLIFLYNNRRETRSLAANEDLIGRTPSAVVEAYLNAEKNKRLIPLYLLTAIESRDEDYDKFAVEHPKKAIAITKYTVGKETKTDKGYQVSVTYSYKEADKNAEGKSEESVKTVENENWTVIKENNVWKVKK